MTRAELDEYLDKRVKLTFKDDRTYEGYLSFTSEFSSKYGYRKPNYYHILHYRKNGVSNIGGLSFKVSHVKKVEEV